MMDGFDGHGWGMGWGWIMGLIIFIVLVWVIVRAMNFNQRTEQSAGKSSPLDILKERYARGEIDKQEFEDRKKDLL